MRSGTLAVTRYGPADKIKDELVRQISSEEQARAVDDWGPSSNSKGARKRRKEREMQQFAERTCVLVGTVEMASNLRTKKPTVILVDEAAQSTEPMTVIPLQFADADTHVILMGDHMQLPPTVLSSRAEWEGLRTSLFERLLRKAGVDSCMLVVQYRMHESICSWPNHEFYMGNLLCDSSVGSRDGVAGFP